MTSDTPSEASKTEASGKSSGPATDPVERPGNLRWYFGGQTAWYAAGGLQMVLFPYLSAFVLGLDARFIGIAQLALMGPGLILLMPAGVIADHLNEKTYLVKLHIAASVPPLLMAFVLFSDQLSFWFLICYAVMAGSLSTLAIPARDSLLNHLVPHAKLNRFIALATALQFGGQLIGMVVAGFAQTIGPAPFFIVHALTMLGGGIALRMLYLPDHEVSHAPIGADLGAYARGIGESVAYLFKSKVLAPVMICNSAIGFLFVGSFMVAVPVFVRDVFNGSALDISYLHISFFVGTVLSALTIMRIGTIHRRGRLMVLGLIMGTGICFATTNDVAFWAFAFFMFCWGLGAGAVMTTSRTIIQEAAPPDMRARLLASFQMGIMGFGPIGSLTMGFVIDAIGVQKAMLVPGLGMAAVLVVVLLTTGFWKLSSEDTAKMVDKA